MIYTVTQISHDVPECLPFTRVYRENQLHLAKLDIQEIVDDWEVDDQGEVRYDTCGGSIISEELEDSEGDTWCFIIMQATFGAETCPKCGGDCVWRTVENSQPANSDASFHECEACNHQFGGDL